MKQRWQAQLKRYGYSLPETLSGYLFLSPVLLWTAIFMLFPLFYIIYLSFFEWNMVDPDKKFIGFSNYTRMLEDNEFIQSVYHTLYFTVGKTVLSVVAALAIAMLLNRKIRGIVLIRGFFYSPVVVSMIAAAMIWGYLFDPQIGPLTQLFKAVGLTAPQWLDDPDWAMSSIIIMSVWKNMGYYAVIYLAALQGISGDYYEAAAIDGATGAKQFIHITWPLLMPATMLVLIMTVIHAFQVFAQVYVMTSGGPLGSTSVIVYYLYEVGFQHFEMGYASAIGFVLFIIMFLVTLVQFKMMDKKIDF
ncbi:carbohydrate ABC transporter permease [Paenibacillus thalictri]|uniref:Sugar ABC transporter permease n=1 Tax=Paenibacillus thalictri TaxID=2527873 RepID=A0A4V2J4B9_9BACL|nr:sugar ABC transporter permease [Paenibacillus thalictri]TBL79012.1 sugar ABC transporter permease [Paenibacillus thalictri]